jgi:hypothetical protein
MRERSRRATADPYRRSDALQAIAAALVAAPHQIQAVPDILNEAMQALSTLPSDNRLAQSLQDIACTYVRIGLPDQAIATARLILVEREQHLPAIVEGVLQANDRTALKDLLISCAAHLKSAWSVCVQLARAYREQLAAIARGARTLMAAHAAMADAW